MGSRARIAVACLAVMIPAMPACATRQVRLQMTREIRLIPPVIRDLSVNPSGQIDTRDQGRTVQVRMTGDPELEATFDLKGGLQGQEMRETEPGVYVGSFQVRPNETGRIDLVAHLLHAPTGARQDITRDGALVLMMSQDQQRTCTPGDRLEFEEQLEALTVRFRANEYEVPTAAQEILADARAILESHPECTIHVHGHADEPGSKEYNSTLSALRAGEVATIIVQNLGVPAERVAVHWHGESQPVDTSRSPEGVARNRRVEMHAFSPE
jgi:outer membrane protein OmpA-like peptidoglycan-associated protein